MIGVTLVLVAMVLASVWLYSRHRHNYWAARGFPSVPGIPVLGSLHRVFSMTAGRWIFDTEIYTKHGGSKFCGWYEIFRPVLMIGDPDIIKHILVKDFDHFPDRRTFMATHEKDDLGNYMLTNINGDVWKTTRSIMTPTFTSGKMKSMFHLVSDKADDLVSFCLDEATKKPHIEMKHNFGRYTLDTIATCAFGIECNSLGNEDAIFPKKASVFFELSPVRLLKFALLFTLPSVVKFLKMRINPPEMDFFKDVMEGAVAARKKGKARGDFLDLLLEARENYMKNTDSSSNNEENDKNSKSSSNGTAHVNDSEYSNESNSHSEHSIESNSHKDNNKTQIKVMSDNSILAQSVLFIIVGYDTTASTLAFSSYFLSKYPETQHRLREEMREIVREHGSITYQGIMEAKYMDACIMETLRLFPPIPMSERISTKQYTLPGTDLTIEPGTLVQYPIWCLHHDPKYWPDPDVFLPDRFLPENKAEIKAFTHMPFGMGPRNCIAMRFALMEAKVALAKMVLATEMTIAPGKEELKLSTGPQILRPEGGVHLIIKPIREE